jgi:hypothetical protein
MSCKSSKPPQKPKCRTDCVQVRARDQASRQDVFMLVTCEEVYNLHMSEALVKFYRDGIVYLMLADVLAYVLTSESRCACDIRMTVSCNIAKLLLAIFSEISVDRYDANTDESSCSRSRHIPGY